MAREYLVEEFIGDNCECTLEEQIDKKVSFLYDMCMLCKHKGHADKREQAVRELLASYQSETQIDNVAHDLILGNYTLEDLLKRKGYIQ